MLIRFSGRADVALNDGSPVTSPEVIHELDGAESDDACGNYIDADLADLGITGGTVRLAYDSTAEGFLVSSEYSAPMKLDPEQLQRLAHDTVGQWSDGIGEGCFDALADRLGVSITLGSLDPETEMHIEQIDDGTPTGPPKTAVATAAREGDLAKMRRLLEAGADLEVRLQGYTALQLAVIYGRAAAALDLIGRGADVNARDPQGSTPLLLAATGGLIADPDAARIARALLERGAAVHGPHGPDADPERGDYTPLYIAGLRKKTQLAAVLNEYGASR